MTNRFIACDALAGLSVHTTDGTTVTFVEDDGTAGVREPCRPKDKPPSLTQEAVPVIVE